MNTITITWKHVSGCNVKHSVTIIGPDAKSVSEEFLATLALDENVADGFTVICDGKDVTTGVLVSMILSTLE